MKFKLKNIANFVGYLVALLIGFGTGALFISGQIKSAFSSIWVLKLIPLIAHQVTGWIIIAGVILGVIVKLLKK